MLTDEERKAPVAKSLAEMERARLDGKPVCWCGARMAAAGRGKYPYDCRAKDEHPDAMIWHCPIHSNWTRTE